MQRTNEVTEVRLKHMLPRDIHDAFQKLPLIFIPVGVLEFHDPHLAFGTDLIHAENISIAAAKRLGGIVLPPIHFGVCHAKPKDALIRQGFKGDEVIVGMDHPQADELYKSFYYSEKLLSLSLKETIRHAIDHSYKYLCVVTGHAAPVHTSCIKKVVEHFSEEDIKILTYLPLMEFEHAAIQETSLMEYYDSRYVDKTTLPEYPEKLAYTKYSIIDANAMIGLKNREPVVSQEADPRNSSKTLGEDIFQELLEQLIKQLERMTSQSKIL